MPTPYEGGTAPAPSSRRPSISGEPLAQQSPEALRQGLLGLEAEAAPLRARLHALDADAELLRAELRRRERMESVHARRIVREAVGSGTFPSLVDLVSAEIPPGSTRFNDLTFVRESASEIRLGYAASSQQVVCFTDGTHTEEALDLETARMLWRRGWEFGTSAARGVRVYPVGSRAEKVVPAAEVHARLE
ncbi:MAG: hypothetical protein NVSMB17_15510 [Candidatus Dormibacteria bacterium]